MPPKPPLQIWIGSIVAPFTLRLMKDEIKNRISGSNLSKNTTVDIWKRSKKLYIFHWKRLEGPNEIAEVRTGGGGRLEEEEDGDFVSQ